VADGDNTLRVEIRNRTPVELSDLALSFQALAEAFDDYAAASTKDPLPSNIRLFVRELRPGSIIADLIAVAEQAQWLVDHGVVLAGFVANTQEIINFLLGVGSEKAPPTARAVSQVAQIVEPIAKDFASQLNIQVSSGSEVNVYNININSRDANALQNSARRFLGPSLPATEIRTDELLILEQVKNSSSAQTGDRGVIESITRRPVKLVFLSEDAKKQVLDLPANPFQCVFLVDVEVKAVDGRPTLYRVIAVKEVMQRPAA
jgi:hypothetical protein